MKDARLLMISTDRKILEEGSAVRLRQIEYAKEWQEVHTVIFTFTKRDGAQNKIQLTENCWLYPTSSSSRFLYSSDAKKIGATICTEHKITNISCQDASLTSIAGVSLKKQFGLPLEIQVHEDLGSKNYNFTLSNRIRKFLAKRNLPKADTIRVVSSRIKDYLINRLKVSANKITIRPIPVNVDWINSAPIQISLKEKYPQFNKIVLMASRLEREKNIELAIKAWPEVIEKASKAGLIIVGDGSELSRLKDLANRLDVGGSIIFESWANQETLASYYKTADLFLNTSLFEGYGMTLVEAHAAGCKIISTDVGVAKEVGAIITDSTSREVAAAIVQALS